MTAVNILLQCPNVWLVVCTVYIHHESRVEWGGKYTQDKSQNVTTGSSTTYPPNPLLEGSTVITMATPKYCAQLSERKRKLWLLHKISECRAFSSEYTHDLWILMFSNLLMLYQYRNTKHINGDIWVLHVVNESVILLHCLLHVLDMLLVVLVFFFCFLFYLFFIKHLPFSAFYLLMSFTTVEVLAIFKLYELKYCFK